MIRIKEESAPKRSAVTKALRNGVAKTLRRTGEQFADNHARLKEVAKFVGRPRVHATNAQKQTETLGCDIPRRMHSRGRSIR